MTTTPILNDVCEFIVDCLHATAPTQTDGYPLIRTPNIGKGRLSLDGVYRVSEETYEKWTQRAVPHPNDLILAREAPAGNVAIVKNGQQVCLGQRTVHLRPDPMQVDPDFLCYYLLAPPQQGALLAGETGATSKHVNMKDIRRLPLTNLPTLDVQHAIGRVIAAYDDLIENNRRRIQLLEQAARLLYKEWFVHLRFPGHEHFTITDGVPEGWERQRLADLCESVSYGYTASATDSPVGPKLLRITDIVPPILNWSVVPHCEIAEGKKKKFLLQTGDIVVARTGATVGYAKRIHKRHPESVFASYLVRLRPYSSIDDHLLGIFVESDDYKAYIQAHVGGAAQPNANAKVIAGAQILVPRESLQTLFRSLVEPMFDQRDMLVAQNERLRKARDLLLPRLMNGEVGV